MTLKFGVPAVYGRRSKIDFSRSGKRELNLVVTTRLEEQTIFNTCIKERSCCLTVSFCNWCKRGVAGRSPPEEHPLLHIPLMTLADRTGSMAKLAHLTVRLEQKNCPTRTRNVTRAGRASYSIQRGIPHCAGGTRHQSLSE